MCEWVDSSVAMIVQEEARFMKQVVVVAVAVVVVVFLALQPIVVVFSQPGSGL